MSFVWSFAGRYVRRLQGGALAFPLLLVLFLLYNPPQDLRLQISVLIIMLYYCCLVCHGELYKLKPAPRDLTVFYLMIATGGALGSAFVTVIAPLIFDDYFELHWSLVMIPVLMTVILWREGGTFVFRGRSVSVWRVAGVVAILFGLMLNSQVNSANKGRVAAFRNFYGVLKLSEMASGKPYQALGLTCGSTLHGFQLMQPGLEDVPTCYFHERSGVGLLMNYVPREAGRRIGVVGLGTGTLAAYGRTNDVIRFYEINPLAIKLATERFSFLSRSKARTEVVRGDARLSLEREPPQQFDALVLDAFDSDAVPVHLLTKEAFQAYERHLKPESVIAVHISSKHLDLVPLLEALAAEFKLDHALIEWAPQVLIRTHGFQMEPWQSFDVQWFLLSRSKEFMNQNEIQGITTPPQAGRKPMRAWTDDYTSLFPLLIW